MVIALETGDLMEFFNVTGDLMVVLYSGITVMCRAGTAIWIPKPVYNRMVTELRIVPST